MLTIFGWNLEIEERCKGVHCVDLGESFPTSIYLQKSASIQPRTSPSKFGGIIQYYSIVSSILERHLSKPETPPVRDCQSWQIRARTSPKHTANSSGLALGCIEADFCNQIFISQFHQPVPSIRCLFRSKRRMWKNVTKRESSRERERHTHRKT